MRIDEFLKSFSQSESFRQKPRLLIAETEQDLRALCKSLAQCSNVEKVRVSDCIQQNTFLPAAPSLFSMLKEKVQAVNQKGHTALIVGLDAIFALWQVESVVTAYRLIQQELDQMVLGCLYVTKNYGSSEQSVFKHPKYKEGWSVLHFGDWDPFADNTLNITFLSNLFSSSRIPGVLLKSLKRFIQECEDGTLAEGDINILIDYPGTQKLAGTNETIVQLLSKEDYLKHFYGLKASFSPCAIDWLYEKLRNSTASGSTLAILQKSFFPEDVNTPSTLQSAPLKMFSTKGAEREVLLYVLKESFSTPSYLLAVLSNPNTRPDNFMEYYVCEALDLLMNPEQKDFAEERKAAVERIGPELISGSILNFLSLSKALPLWQIAPWLNIQYLPVKYALIQHIIDAQGAENFDPALKAYPLLEAYVAPYTYGNEELDDYFKAYRQQKITNTLDEAFCEKAANVNCSIKGIKSRKELLQTYVKDEGAALLVVDALGAEYFPMLLDLATKHSLPLVDAKVAYSELPTSTKFNKFDWPVERKLPEIKAFDGLVHNGAELHAERPVSENIVAQLELFRDRILREVAKNLTRYDKVILTSDHGASRLAVLCAEQKKCCQDVDLPETSSTGIDDWRYTAARDGKSKPAEMTETLDGKYWVMKGYNRLKKKGGKIYELHGGLTYEECLVPFLVFGHASTFKPTVKTSNSEFVEDVAFDL